MKQYIFSFLLFSSFLTIFSCSSQTTNNSSVNIEEMVFVKGGTFQMGSNDGNSHERPVHTVTLSDFYICKYEVTYKELDAYCKTTEKSLFKDLGFGRGLRPVVFISWFQAVEFCNWKSEQHNLQPVYTINRNKVSANWNANGFRLPTEAEWEFAARDRGGNEKWAGTSSKSQLTSFGNFCDRKCPLDWAKFWYNDGYSKTAPVGSFKSNKLGLFDMSGNVDEMCWDWYNNSDYSKIESTTNPTGFIRGTYPYRVVRGGSWYDKMDELRCTRRNGGAPSSGSDLTGFRLARAGE